MAVVRGDARRHGEVQSPAIMDQASLGVGGVRVFETRQRVGLHAAAFIAGGVIFFLMLIVQFLLALGRKSTPGTDMMPGIIGGLSVFGIALIARGIFLLRGVTRVVLDDGGVQVEGFIARRSISYQQIERVERDKKTQMLAGKTNEVLMLRVAGERQPLAIIPDTIDRFEELAAELAWRTAAAQGGRTTYDPVADQQSHQTREAKNLKLTAALLWAFTILFVAMLCFGVYEEVHSRRLKSSGTTVDARIDQRFMRRVTPYIAYSFRDRHGNLQSREVMVTQELYDATEGAATVPVVYLADKPDWNRPIAGDAGTNFGGRFLFLLAGGTLMFGTFAVLTLFGIDIKVENGRTMVVKRGKVIREFGPKPAPPALPPPPQFEQANATLPTLAAAEEGELVAATAPSPPGPAADGDAAVRASVAWHESNASQAAMMPPPPDKPKGLFVLGVLCILFGMVGVGFGVLRAAMFAMTPTRTIDVGNQVMIVEQPSFAAYWAIADAALGAALIVTGIGLLMLKRWSRSMGIPVAVLQILSSLGAAGMVIATMASDPAAPDGPESMTVITLNIASIVFKLLTAVFPAVLLFILMKRSTKDTLARRELPAL
jgi:hypothetical protein